MAVQVVLADPPWAYGAKTLGNGGDITPPYATLSLAQLKTMAPSVADDAVLFLWVTSSKMADGIALMSAWGFTFKTVFLVWNKRYASGAIASGPGT